VRWPPDCRAVPGRLPNRNLVNERLALQRESSTLAPTRRCPSPDEYVDDLGEDPDTTRRNDDE